MLYQLPHHLLAFGNIKNDRVQDLPPLERDAAGRQVHVPQGTIREAVLELELPAFFLRHRDHGLVDLGR